jgi:peptide/nickel transport system substrate-binding protein
MKKWLLGGIAAALMIAGATAPAFAEYKAEHRGGTMRILAHQAGGTIDPHINYTLQYWQIYQSVYDGLVNFQKSAGAEGFTKVPDIAEAIPGPTNDGKTYVFKIRKGIKFSS